MLCCTWECFLPCPLSLNHWIRVGFRRFARRESAVVVAPDDACNSLVPVPSAGSTEPRYVSDSDNTINRLPRDQMPAYPLVGYQPASSPDRPSRVASAARRPESLPYFNRHFRDCRAAQA